MFKNFPLFLYLAILPILMTTGHNDAENPEAAKSRRRTDNAKLEVEDCLAKLGIPYHEPCNEIRILYERRQFVKLRKEGLTDFKDQMDLSRKVCRSYPHASACQNGICVCTLVPICDDDNIVAPPTCSQHYQEYRRLTIQHLKYHPVLHNHTSENGGKDIASSGMIWNINNFQILMTLLTTMLRISNFF